MVVNDVIHGFRLLRQEKIEEIDAQAFEFCHEQSGARLFFLQNDDDNKVFSISFRTPPFDDTGVAHIVEHSTLCGSRKFPLKEPFVELVKGSLNTFLNAMTFPDKTMYPVASRNDKDFQNLMDVYLDAVFYPAMYENEDILRQEGWHYAISETTDPLRYSGVVYNEMKGALSSPEGILDSRVKSLLYPETPYRYESGGNPKSIPDLTQEKFLNFHRRYYHPSNSYIYLYGDLDMDAKLAFLDKEYLAAFSRQEVSSSINRQETFTVMKKMTESYPIGRTESKSEKTFLSLSFSLGDGQNVVDMLALQVLEHALLISQAAPLRQALIDARLGKGVSSMLEDSLCQPYLSIIVNGSEGEQLERLATVTEDTLRSLAENGIDKILLEASLNLLEFKLREADYGTYPKGLIYNIKLMNTWLYGGRPEAWLKYEPLVAKLKQGLQEDYFEKLIKKYFLHNQHKLLFALQPDNNLGEKQEKDLAQKLVAKKEKMSLAEIIALADIDKHLKERQQMDETPEALATIPVLSLSDIKKEADELISEEAEVSGIKVLKHTLFTNGIVYLRFFFDAGKVPQDLLPYAYLLAELLGTLDTDKHSYQELANLLNLHTGGIGYDLTAVVREGEPDSCQPRFVISAKAVTGKMDKLCALLQEILTNTSFDDVKRLSDVVRQCYSSVESSLLQSSNQIMASRLISYTTPAGKYNEQGELSFYYFLKDLIRDFDSRKEELQSILHQLLPVVFNIHGLIVSVTGGSAEQSAAGFSLPDFVQGLSAAEFPQASYKWQIDKANEGLLSASQVQYVGKGANFLKLGYRFTGAMKVLETLMRYGYLWTRIRVQGGAYGALTQFGRSGTMIFASYRDPHLRTTLAVFDSIAAYLKDFQITDRELLKAIIGTMSLIDMPLTAKRKGALADDCWLRHITQADRQKIRDEILGTDQQDIRNLAEVVEACMRENIICVFGNEAKLKENKDLFGCLRSVMD